MYDVVVIGAGVSGASIARELSRLDARVLVVEREDDVCCGTTKANSAIVHAGYDARPGSLMARLNVEGSRLMPTLCAELGVDFKPIGSLVVCTNEDQLAGLDDLLAQGVQNGVSGLRIVYRDELVQMEPNVSDAAVAALYAPTAGIVNPFQLNTHLAECAAQNGVEFLFNAQVTGVECATGENGFDGTNDLRSRDGDDDANSSDCPDGTNYAWGEPRWVVRTTKGDFTSRAVVNAAGVHADEIHNMVSNEALSITPRRGQYYVLDTTAGRHVRHVVFSQPTKMGKGVLVAPTTAGNLLVGPSAEDIDDKGGADTTSDVLADVASKAAITVRDVPLRETITSFSGLRAHQPGHDFVICEVPGAPRFFDCAAIESPGLSAAPAIGLLVAGMVRDALGLGEKDSFDPVRPPIPNVEWASPEEWEALIRRDPAFGRVVCRCRKVTEAQIVDAIHRPLGARSLDAVKRRTEACMGRCQAGFCTPKIMEILAREVDGLGMDGVTKAGPGSEIVVGTNKDRLGALAGEGHGAADPLPRRCPEGGDAQ